jgi:putative phosphoserine phosphatase/1-acylglycerol-3-phosphate O-acyltransferase
LARSAAIFDLDRTLLRGASGPSINDALAAEGLRTTRLPGESLIYRSYELLGENPIGILLARAAALAVRGWPVERVRTAAVRAAELLAPEVTRYAPGLIAEHRRAGRTIVLATTTPEDLIAPLARMLGMDAVLATRYASSHGVYTGRLEGGFVWGPGKLRALRAWADHNDIDLGDSFAYSDSVNDLPMLSAAGHPVAVNPDPCLHMVAALRRWPVLHLDVPPGVPTIAGVEMFDIARYFVRPELFPYARFDISGVENIPAKGPFILVANHRSYFDVVALALVVQQTGRATRFLGKKAIFDAPLVGLVARALGGIPVERGGDASSSLASAERVLRAGEGIAVLPQGTIPRGQEFFAPELRGKTGAARLAATTLSPVIPVGVWNTEAVWPRSAKLPRLANVASPPTVRIRVGPAIEGLSLGPLDAPADTATIMRAIASLLPDEARQPRVPTEAELARTYPDSRSHQAQSPEELTEPATASRSGKGTPRRRQGI